MESKPRMRPLEENPGKPIACGSEEIFGLCRICFHGKADHSDQGFCSCQAIDGSTPCWRRGRSQQDRLIRGLP